MLAAFVMIVIGALIIWIATEPWEIAMRLWIKIGYQLFRFIVIHSDEENGNCYGLTFTNDNLWQEKMLKDFRDSAEKKNHEDGK